MDLLGLFRKPKLKLRPKYAPIHRSFQFCEDLVRKALVKDTCIQDTVRDMPMSLAYMGCEVFLFLYATMLEKMKKHQQAPAGQQELRAEFETLYQLTYNDVVEDPMALLVSRTTQHIERLEQNYGHLKCKLNIINSVLFFQQSYGEILPAPASWLDKTSPEEIGELVVKSGISEARLALKEETDEGVQTMRLLLDKSIWLGSTLVALGTGNVFKNCVDISVASEDTIKQLLTDGLKRQLADYN